MKDGTGAEQDVDSTRALSGSSITTHTLIAPLLILATFLLCVFPLMDTDLWWHLKTGQLIWERGDVPRSDWFTFSDADRPWIDLHWGFQLFVALLYALGGVNLIILAKAAVISTAVGVGWFAAGKDSPAWLRAAVWIPAVICITGRGYERPEMLSQLFLAMWLWIAFRVEREPRWIWALPAIQIVWINCHALFVLGLVIGGCFAVDYFLRYVANGRFGLEPVSAVLKPLWVFGSAVGCGFAALVNPYFLDGALFPLVLYRKFSVEQEFYASIGEFQSPLEFLFRNGLRNIYLDAELLLGMIALGSFLAVMKATGRWSPFRLLVFAAFGNLALEASRNVNIFAIVAAVIAAANMADAWRAWISESNQPHDKRTEARKTITQPPPPAHAYANIAICCSLIVWIGLTVTGVWGHWSGENKAFGLGEQPWWFGHDAMKFAGQPGFPDRAIIAHIGLAATYEFHNGPDKKVLLDPRLEVCSQQTFAMQDAILGQMARGDRSWELLMRDKQGRLPVVILDSRGSRPIMIGLSITGAWRLVYCDPSAAVFLSNRQADELNLPPADASPLNETPGVMKPPARPVPGS